MVESNILPNSNANKLQLRCSGQKSGCDRCKAVDYPCIYSPVAHSRGPRKLNRRGGSAGRETVKKRQRSSNKPRQVEPLHSYPYDCEYDSARGSIQGKGQKDDQEGNRQQPGSQYTTYYPDVTKTLTDNPIGLLSSLSAGFEDYIRTSCESQMPLANDFSYSTSTAGPWASFTTATSDTCFTNPADLMFDEFGYDSTAGGYILSSSSPPSSSGVPLQLRGPEAPPSTWPNIGTIIGA